MHKLLTLLAAMGDSCDPNTGSSEFFGLVPWYKYLGGEEDMFGKCVPVIGDSGSGIWVIGLAIIDSLLRIAGMVAVGFVIYGGFQLMTGQGEPEKVKGARETILNSVIGLVIAILAATVVSFIGNTLK